MENTLPFESDKLLEKYKPDFAFAYGSGVFPEQAPKGSTQLDFVFGIKNPVAWHERNLKENPKDYSLAARETGPIGISTIQKKGPGIYYHSFVQFQGKEIKYGVISIDAIVDDLLNWTHLYVAGRMQKPVQVLKSDINVQDAMKTNLEKALLVSAVLLPEDFTERQLFETIISLSYLGDSRMQFGVDPGKVNRIVDAQYSRLQALYNPILELPLVRVVLSKDKCTYRKNLGTTVTQVFVHTFLPFALSKKMEKCNARSDDYKIHLRKALIEIVKSSSTAQTLKGIFSTGFSRSIRYATEKLEKAKIKD